jgi:hypothetical protein
MRLRKTLQVEIAHNRLQLGERLMGFNVFLMLKVFFDKLCGRREGNQYGKALFGDEL